MQTVLFDIKDSCRNNLTKYMLEAFSKIPLQKPPRILDMGCGTGVSALALIDRYNALVYAVDSDPASISYLDGKIRTQGYENRIRTFNASALEPGLFENDFDIVMAEGLLNIIGFRQGLSVLLGYLKPGGHIFLHEAFFDDAQEDIVYRQYDLNLLHCAQLDAHIWKTEYFNCLEAAIYNRAPSEKDALRTECTEIDWFKNNPMGSAYYILQKNNAKS